MSKMLIDWGLFGIVVGTIVILIGLTIIIWYTITVSTLKRSKAKVQEAALKIDISLTQRHDLFITMLTATKGYALQEKKILERIVELRQPEKDAIIEDKEQFANEITNGIHEVNLIIERYPDLKASTQFLKLQDGAVEVDENLQAARRLYNSNVSTYNRQVVVWPSSIVAKKTHHSQINFFETNEIKRQDK